MSINSLSEQVANPDITKKQVYIEWVPFIGPLPIIGKEKFASTWNIKCLDKNEQEKIIKVTGRTQIRITKKDKSKYVFYFSSIKIKDSTITGYQSVVLKLQIEPIKIKDVFKIEIQTGEPTSNNNKSPKINNNYSLTNYNLLLKDGDTFMRNKQYDMAISKYNEASLLFPEKSYPKLQIEKAKSFIK